MTEHELAPQQKNLWLKGVSAFQLKNYDYAISLVLSVVRQHPEFLDGRKLLRRAEAEKFRGQKKGLFGGVSISFKASGTSKKEPWEAIAELEENVFQKDPFNVNANQSLFDYASRMAVHDLAAFALETIREGHPDNTKNLHRLAEHDVAELVEGAQDADVVATVTKDDQKALVQLLDQAGHGREAVFTGVVHG
jgi:hypothetical protein